MCCQLTNAKAMASELETLLSIPFTLRPKSKNLKPQTPKIQTPNSNSG